MQHTLQEYTDDINHMEATQWKSIPTTQSLIFIAPGC